jgi:hypothetical protein
MNQPCYKLVHNDLTRWWIYPALNRFSNEPILQLTSFTLSGFYDETTFRKINPASNQFTTNRPTMNCAKKYWKKYGCELPILFLSSETNKNIKNKKINSHKPSLMMLSSILNEFHLFLFSCQSYLFFLFIFKLQYITNLKLVPFDHMKAEDVIVEI